MLWMRIRPLCSPPLLLPAFPPLPTPRTQNSKWNRKGKICSVKFLRCDPATAFHIKNEAQSAPPVVMDTLGIRGAFCSCLVTGKSQKSSLRHGRRLDVMNKQDRHYHRSSKCVRFRFSLKNGFGTARVCR